jgi:hypothetical protein
MRVRAESHCAGLALHPDRHFGSRPQLFGLGWPILTAERPTTGPLRHPEVFLSPLPT